MKNEEKGTKESASLTKLRSLVKFNGYLAQIEMLVYDMPANEKIQACIICQESDNKEVRDSFCEMAKVSLGMYLVADGLASLLDGQESRNEHVREFCKNQFYRLSSRQLSFKINVLFEKLKSPYTLVRYYAEELLLKIEEPEIIGSIEFLYNKYISEILDTRRVARRMMIKAMRYWETTDMRKNSDVIAKLSKLDNDDELSNLAKVAILSIMRESSGTEDVKLQWPFLLSCRESKSDEIYELSTLISLRCMNHWSLSELESEIDYLSDLRHSTHNEVRRSSRDLALTIIETWLDVERIYSKHEFLIACRESKFLAVRHRAKVLLDKIPAEMFFRNVKRLLSWHAIGSPKICGVIKKILLKIPADMYTEALEYLFETQMSYDSKHAELGYELATQISPEALKTKSALIDQKCLSGKDEVVNLAQDLQNKLCGR